MRTQVLAVLGAAAAAVAAVQGPCDIYGAAGTPCVAAHALTRALYGGYAGPLYRVQRASDGKSLDVGVVTPGGVANSAAQDAFCAADACSVLRIYDQSPRNNHLDLAPPGGAAPHSDNPVNATRLPITLLGAKVYGAYFEGGQGYRIDNTTGIATGNDPETLYMVTSGTHVNGGCCFDYGNAETNNRDTGAGSMEAVYFGNSTGWGSGSGSGPWVMADLEDGLWAGNTKVYPGNTPVNYTYVTAMVKGGTNGFALKAGDASGAAAPGLVTMYDGPRPNGYQPMRKQGAIILGIGGDNSDWAIGTFFEGLITSGYTTDAADNAVQANIVAAGYGR